MSDLVSFELSDGERLHPLWVRLRAHFETQLQTMRMRNDRAMPELETATTRGHIQFLKAAIALGDARPLTED